MTDSKRATGDDGLEPAERRLRPRFLPGIHRRDGFALLLRTAQPADWPCKNKVGRLTTPSWVTWRLIRIRDRQTSEVRAPLPPVCCADLSSYYGRTTSPKVARRRVCPGSEPRHVHQVTIPADGKFRRQR